MSTQCEQLSIIVLSIDIYQLIFFLLERQKDGERERKISFLHFFSFQMAQQLPTQEPRTSCCSPPGLVGDPRTWTVSVTFQSTLTGSYMENREPGLKPALWCGMRASKLVAYLATPQCQPLSFCYKDSKTCPLSKMVDWTILCSPVQQILSPDYSRLHHTAARRLLRVLRRIWKVMLRAIYMFVKKCVWGQLSLNSECEIPVCR